MGASLRAAIDFVLVAEQLAILRDVTLSHAPDDEQARRTLVGAAQTAFSIKIVVREAARRTADEVVEEVVNAALSNPPPPDEVPERIQMLSQTKRATRHRRRAAMRRASPATRLGTVTGAKRSSDEKVGDDMYGSSGRRTYGAFAREHPELAERLQSGGDGAWGRSRLALEEHAGDRLELLGEMTELHDRADLREHRAEAGAGDPAARSAAEPGRA